MFTIKWIKSKPICKEEVERIYNDVMSAPIDEELIEVVKALEDN